MAGRYSRATVVMLEEDRAALRAQVAALTAERDAAQQRAEAAEAGVAAMRAVLNKWDAIAFFSERCPHCAQGGREIRYCEAHFAAMQDAQVMRRAALSTTAGAALLERLRLAREALEAWERAEKESNQCTRCHLAAVRYDGGQCDDHGAMVERATELRAAALAALRGEG